MEIVFNPIKRVRDFDIIVDLRYVFISLSYIKLLSPLATVTVT